MASVLAVCVWEWREGGERGEREGRERGEDERERDARARGRAGAVWGGVARALSSPHLSLSLSLSVCLAHEREGMPNRWPGPPPRPRGPGQGGPPPGQTPGAGQPRRPSSRTGGRWGGGRGAWVSAAGAAGKSSPGGRRWRQPGRGPGRLREWGEREREEGEFLMMGWVCEGRVLLFHPRTRLPCARTAVRQVARRQGVLVELGLWRGEGERRKERERVRGPPSLALSRRGGAGRASRERASHTRTLPLLLSLSLRPRSPGTRRGTGPRSALSAGPGRAPG